MILERTSAPAVTPITVAELKEHLRISHTAADDYLADLVDTVTDELDGRAGYLQRALITQTWTLKVDRFPSIPTYGGYRRWCLPLPPLQSVSSIAYYDENDDTQTYSIANYAVHTPEVGAGFIELKNGSEWPNVYDREDAITVTFVAGYGDAETSIPQRIRTACKLLAASLYANRGDAVTDRGVDPALMKRLLTSYRWPEFV